MAIALRIACLIVLAASIGPAAAEKVYRWVDAQGKVHYSDQPRGNAQPVEVKPGSGPGNPAAAAPAPSDTQSAVQKAVDCEKQRSQLETYRQAERIVEKDALGTEREYTAEQKERLVKLTEESFRAACGSSS